MTTPVDTLLTLRDWLRYAVSRFRKAEIVYYQGTTNALDEAAFLLLWGLDLPIDQLEPFLDARLMVSEREKLLGLIEARITTRKPAAYLTGEAWIKNHRFVIDERVIIPRSYLGELLSDPSGVVIEAAERATAILDLCTGCACLAILAGLVNRHATIDATDLSADALAVARRNVEDYEMSARIRLLEGDMFAPVAGKRYDLIICNPPYIRDAVVANYTPEHKAEPKVAHAGGPDGLSLVRRVLADAAAHLTPNGKLLVEVGTEKAGLEADYPQMPFLWLDTEDSEGEVFVLDAADLVSSLPAGAAVARAPARRRK